MTTKGIPNFTVRSLNALANETYKKHLTPKPEKSGEGANDGNEEDEPREADANGNFFPEDKSSEQISSLGRALLDAEYIGF